jgi:hypothetical protein
MKRRGMSGDGPPLGAQGMESIEGTATYATGISRSEVGGE